MCIPAGPGSAAPHIRPTGDGQGAPRWCVCMCVCVCVCAPARVREEREGGEEAMAGPSDARRARWVGEWGLHSVPNSSTASLYSFSLQRLSTASLYSFSL